MPKKGRSARQLSRRDFLKFSVPATTGLFVLGGAPGTGLVAAAAETAPPELKGWALLYNTMLCQGNSCRACTNGCREWNKLSKPDPPVKSTAVEGLATNTWIAINDRAVPRSDGTNENNFFKAQCRHCTSASCVSACPTGAMSYHGEYTAPSQTWCIGCGYCAQACPFGVPQLGEPKNTATKCRFCFDRLTKASTDKSLLDPDTIDNPTIKGLTTECALGCPVRPVKALRFGRRDELIATAKNEVADLVRGFNPYTGKPLTTPMKDAHLYGDSEVISGGSHVLFILSKPNSFYGLPEGKGLANSQLFPEAPQYVAKKVPARWGTGIATAGALAILPFWLLFMRKQELAGQRSGVEGDVK